MLWLHKIGNKSSVLTAVKVGRYEVSSGFETKVYFLKVKENASVYWFFE